jgi:hypothetical protein
MTDTKKPKATAKSAPVKKQVKPAIVAKPQKVAVVQKVVKPVLKKPTVVPIAVKPKAKPIDVPVKKVAPKNIQKKSEPSVKKIDVQRSEVSSFMHEMQKQAL